MGYWVVTVVLKDGRTFPQTAATGEAITRIRNHETIPFSQDEIDHLKVTHEKWNWSEKA